MTGRADRARAAGLWLRDTGLGAAGYVLVATVAVAGWSASFVGLHQFATDHMGLADTPAWLVPVTFDGAALGLTVSVARAAMHGRGAMVWRLLVVAFTGLSSWINYVHISDPAGRWVAALLPVSAVTVFESLMSEARSAYERRTGRVRPRIHPLRWVMDRRGTWEIVRAYVLDVPLPDRLATARERARDTDSQAPATPPTNAPANVPVGVRESARDTDSHAPATRTSTRPRTPSRTRPRATASTTTAPVRRLYPDILATAREALTDDVTVTPTWVREVTGCGRTTATRVAADLTAERTPSARVVPLTR